MDEVLRDLRVASRGTARVLDLSSLAFIRPAHMVGAAALADLCSRHGLAFHLLGPRRL